MEDQPIFQFSFTDILSTISPSILWLSFGIAIFLSVLISCALFYHWKRYDFKSPQTKIAQFAYIVGLLIIFCFAGSMLLLYSSHF